LRGALGNIWLFAKPESRTLESVEAEFRVRIDNLLRDIGVEHLGNTLKSELDKSGRPADEPSPFDPAMVIETSLRYAIWMCWVLLPPDRRDTANVERQVRRLADRAVSNMREDGAAFGFI
jgi:hypothetical protein